MEGSEGGAGSGSSTTESGGWITGLSLANVEACGAFGRGVADSADTVEEDTRLRSDDVWLLLLEELCLAEVESMLEAVTDSDEDRSVAAAVAVAVTAVMVSSRLLVRTDPAATESAARLLKAFVGTSFPKSPATLIPLSSTRRLMIYRQTKPNTTRAAVMRNRSMISARSRETMRFLEAVRMLLNVEYCSPVSCKLPELSSVQVSSIWIP